MSKQKDFLGEFSEKKNLNGFDEFITSDILYIGIFSRSRVNNLFIEIDVNIGSTLFKLGCLWEP